MALMSTVAFNSNPMNFTENQQGNCILEKLRLQKESGKLCDVVIYVEAEKFVLHRNVLASFSPYFERQFYCNKTTKEQFRITCQNSEIFKYFVNYMYSGSIVIHSNNVYDLLKLAHRLEVTKIKSYCAEYLERNLELTNCLKVKEVSSRYNLLSLNNQATQLIKNNICAVLNGKELLEVNEEVLEMLLADENIAFSPVDVARAVLDWVRYDVSSRETELHRFLRIVKWSEIEMQFINNLLDNENLFITSELSMLFVLKGLSQSGINFPKYTAVYENLNQKYAHVGIREKQRQTPDRIHKVSMQRKKKKRLVRGNPIARLAALRSALLLRRRRSVQRDRLAKERLAEQMKLEALEENEIGSSGPLKCHLCTHLASDTTALEHHLSSVHSRDVTYKCGVCGYVCQWNNLYLQHVRGHFPGPPYKCDSCEFTCDKLNAVMTHRSIHLEDKSYRCLQCGFRSRTQSSLLAHTKCHVSPTGGHDKGGQGTERNYACDFCGFTSKFLSHLIAHKRIHTGDVYRCSYPHCKFTTGKKTQLGSHAKSHQGSRPHCCQICGRGFLEKSHLVRHERIHLEEKPFKCHECDYASSRRDKLKEHQARHHGDHASAKVPYKARPNKKSSQGFRDSYSPSDVGARSHHGNHSSSTSDISEGLVQQHVLTTAPVNGYPAFPSNDPHAHHASSAVASTIDFHSQQLLTTSRTKDHRVVQQTSAAAAAVTAAMMLDPRFHPGNGGGGAYVAPVTGVIPQSGSQVSHHSHQVPEYPTALMSLF